MKFVPMLLIVWGAFSAGFLGLLAYNATLSRYEDDQMFLSDNNPELQRRQNSIVRQANLTRPLVRVCGAMSAVLGLALLALYTWDAWLKIHPG